MLYNARKEKAMKYKPTKEKIYFNPRSEFPNLKIDLIKELEIYRLENRISQEDLAEKLGVAFSTVNRWLNGKTKPNKIQSYHIEKLLKEKKYA